MKLKIMIDAENFSDILPCIIALATYELENFGCSYKMEKSDFHNIGYSMKLNLFKWLYIYLLMVLNNLF